MNSARSACSGLRLPAPARRRTRSVTHNSVHAPRLLGLLASRLCAARRAGGMSCPAGAPGGSTSTCCCSAPMPALNSASRCRSKTSPTLIALTEAWQDSVVRSLRDVRTAMKRWSEDKTLAIRGTGGDLASCREEGRTGSPSASNTKCWRAGPAHRNRAHRGRAIRAVVTANIGLLLELHYAA